MEEARCLVVLVLAVTVLATSGAEHEHETLHRERRQAQHDDKGPDCDKLDVIFALDSSASVGAENWIQLRQFTVDLIERLNIGRDKTQVGLVTFGDITYRWVELSWFSRRDALITAVSTVPYTSDRANTSGAVWYIRERMFRPELGDRPDAPNILVLMTDGPSEVGDVVLEANRAKNGANPVTIVAVGVGDQVNRTELRAVASVRKMRLVSDFNTLFTAVEPTLSLMCARPRSDYDDDATQRVDNIIGGNQDQGCGFVDLCLVIDSSGSIRDNNPVDNSVDNWDLVLEFASLIVESFEVGLYKTRIGALVFSERIILAFPLNGFNEKSRVIEAIKSIQYMGFTTNTPDALRVLSCSGSQLCFCR